MPSIGATCRPARMADAWCGEKPGERNEEPEEETFRTPRNVRSNSVGLSPCGKPFDADSRDGSTRKRAGNPARCARGYLGYLARVPRRRRGGSRPLTPSFNDILYSRETRPIDMTDETRESIDRSRGRSRWHFFFHPASEIHSVNEKSGMSDEASLTNALSPKNPEGGWSVISDGTVMNRNSMRNRETAWRGSFFSLPPLRARGSIPLRRRPRPPDRPDRPPRNRPRPRRPWSSSCCLCAKCLSMLRYTARRKHTWGNWRGENDVHEIAKFANNMAVGKGGGEERSLLSRILGRRGAAAARTLCRWRHQHIHTRALTWREDGTKLHLEKKLSV